MTLDDVVIVKDDNLPRNRWQLARVVQTYASDDGLVRKVKVVVADHSIDEHGRRSKAPLSFERPVQKLLLLMHCSQALTEAYETYCDICPMSYRVTPTSGESHKNYTIFVRILPFVLKLGFFFPNVRPEISWAISNLLWLKTWTYFIAI